MKIPNVVSDPVLAEEILLAPPADEAIEAWEAALRTALQAAPDAESEAALQAALQTVEQQ